ncbi:MAG: alpha/beta hydrolase family protein [Chloroflexota bacterium]
MALCTLHYRSTALQKVTAATVILPEDGMTGPFPVFYLLHGYSDDHTVWTRNTSLERYAARLPLIIVMPDGGHGFYADAREGYAYDTAITRDLIGFVDSRFHTDPRREARVIGGLSMGGYGAIRLALTHPHLFCSAVSHSGVLAWSHDPFDLATPRGAAAARIAGPSPLGGPNDLFALAERSDRALLPALRIDCGTDDTLIEHNRRFHAHLDRLGISHEYAEFPGAHDWAYWDEHVRDALAFHMRALDPRPAAGLDGARVPAAQ